MPNEHCRRVVIENLVSVRENFGSGHGRDILSGECIRSVCHYECGFADCRVPYNCELRISHERYGPNQRASSIAFGAYPSVSRSSISERCRRDSSRRLYRPLWKYGTLAFDTCQPDVDFEVGLGTRLMAPPRFLLDNRHLRACVSSLASDSGQ